jgi:hypothetical protein
MAESYLQRYRDEIIRLHGERYTQGRIRRHLEETYNIDVPKTTLANFMRELRADGLIGTAAEPRVSPEEEHFLEQYEVHQSLQQSSKEILDATARMLARMKNLDDAMRERTDGILEALQTVLDAVERRPSAQEASWPRALLITGAFWAFLLVLGAAVYLAP